MIREALHSIWRYRFFIFGTVKKEFQSKYHNSLLGISWTIINPLTMILIYTVIFSQVMRAKLPLANSSFSYSIYLCAGLLTWSLFAEISGRSLRVFIENSDLLKKLNFPHICLPIIVVLTAGINFSIIFSIFTVFLLVTGNFPGFVFLAILPLLLLHAAFAIGLGTILGLLNVFFRDVGQLYGVVLQLWFWLTPIVYTVEILPEFVRPFLILNPLAQLTISYQTILVNGQIPKWGDLWLVCLMTILFHGISLRLFYKYGSDMVDEL